MKYKISRYIFFGFKKNNIKFPSLKQKNKKIYIWKQNSSSYEFFETGQSTSYEHQLILKDAYKTVFGKDLTFKLQSA